MLGSLNVVHRQQPSCALLGHVRIDTDRVPPFAFVPNVDCGYGTLSMPEPTYIRDISTESLDRCLASDSCISSFYKRFLGTSPVVRSHFANTDMDTQQKALAQMLRVLGSAVVGDPHGLAELAARAETHSRRRMNITPDLYELWYEALMVTASEHDPAWSPEIEAAWRHTLELAIQYMIARA